MPLYPDLQALASDIQSAPVSEPRKSILKPLQEYIRTTYQARNPIRLHFICTHNSRRSHLAQIWAQMWAYHFSIPQVNCYSGGTEVTAMYPMVLKTLCAFGFRTVALSSDGNPVYGIKYAPNEPAIIGFSKKMDHAVNPESEFCAIMTCDAAHEACPIVQGAEVRLPITYADPKEYDHSPQEAPMYRERSLQIATEMHYVFSGITTP